MRNVKEIIDTSIGGIAGPYDMTFGNQAADYETIRSLANGDSVELAYLAFRYGYEMGHRATVSGAYDKAMRSYLKNKKIQEH